MAIKTVADKLSPASSNRLMCASFTPRQTKLKSFVIPKNVLPDTLRVSPSATWHKDNFPDPANKQKFVIGCDPNPKVIDQSIINESKFLITTLQVAKAGPEAS